MRNEEMRHYLLGPAVHNLKPQGTHPTKMDHFDGIDDSWIYFCSLQYLMQNHEQRIFPSVEKDFTATGLIIFRDIHEPSME